MYIALHEGGHALVAVCCGARITKFSVFGAYTAYEGGTFTAVTLSLTNIAGMLLRNSCMEEKDHSKLLGNSQGAGYWK